MTVALRSKEPITDEHLRRLAAVAAADREQFLRGSPEYRDRVIAVVLAQGAAQHYVDGITGVKDLDVYTFCATIPGHRFPADRRLTRHDFGPSSLGRQLYDLDEASDETQRRQWQSWAAFEGRRVDSMMRGLRHPVDAEPAEAIRDWLRTGLTMGGRQRPGTAWHVAKKAVVLLVPAARAGEVIWRRQDR